MPTSAAAEFSLVAYGWGANSQGQVGDATRVAASRPVPVLPSAVPDVVAVDAGDTHSLALDRSGKVHAWGDNLFGDVGDGTTILADRPVPVAMPRDVLVTAIAAGRFFSVALARNGTAYAWGANESGQLGVGDTSDRLVPEPVSMPNGVTFTAVAAGARFGVALGSDFRTYAWGDNSYGQLGNGTTTGSLRPVAVQMPIGVAFTTVVAGSAHVVALGSDGRTYSWGYNTDGQLGDGSYPVTHPYATAPVLVATPVGVPMASIAAGGNTSAAIGTDGLLYAWGWNQFDQLGRDVLTTMYLPAPALVPAPVGRTFVSVAVGGTFMLALDRLDGTFSWGSNSFGQLGRDITSNQTPLPGRVEVPAGTRLYAVSAGESHAVATVVVTAPPADPSGEFTPVTPARILDTRDGTGGRIGALGPAETIEVQVGGVGEVPAHGAVAVVMNVTATEATASTFVTIWPNGERPANSNLNVSAGQTVPNLVTVALSVYGSVRAYNHAGSVHLLMDVVGFYVDVGGRPGSRYHAVDPFRLFDTRDGAGGVAAAAVGAADSVVLDVRGRGGVPATGVHAIAMNVTAAEPSANTFVTVVPDGVGLPIASNLNVVAGQTVPNLVIVGVPSSGFVRFYNHAGSVHLVADVVGYYDEVRVGESGRFVAVEPGRMLDTRELGAPVGPAGVAQLVVTGRSGVPASGVGAVVLNVTVTEPTAAGYLTVFPDDACSVPLASNLNFTAGTTVPNLVMVRVSTGGGCSARLGSVDFYNHAGAAHVVADVFGWFTA